MMHINQLRKKACEFCGILVVFMLFLFTIGSTSAVTTTTRYVSIGGVDSGTCSSSSSPCATPAYAVSQAVAGDTIQIGAGTFSVQLLAISKNLTIQGGGMTNTFLDGGNANYVLNVSGVATMLVNDLTIQNGTTTTDWIGGGISITNSSVTFNRIRVKNNSGKQAGGLYIQNSAVTLNDSLIDGNSGTADTGGIYAIGSGTMTLNRVTLINNSGSLVGGINMQPSGTVNITNSTISGNQATQASNGEGAIRLTSTTANISFTTIVGNTGTDAGILINSSTVRFLNSIIALNTGAGGYRDCRKPAGSIDTLGHNIDSNNTCGLTDPTDMHTTDIHVGPVQDNGGYTPTIGLLPGSPAINSGCYFSCPETDQRGVSRPQVTLCDIGAVEYQAPGAFSKSGPVDGAANLTPAYTLSWNTSANALAYWYCYYKSGATCSWVNNGTATTAPIINLEPGATYGWQVKAVNHDDTTYANSNTAWSFSIRALPGGFSKTSPIDEAVNQSEDLTLSWGSSNDADSYQYCLDETPGETCDTSWSDAGTATSVPLSGLDAATYYWQVRSQNTSGFTTAGEWWSFTVPDIPGDFNLTVPTNGATNRPRNLTLSWTSSTDTAEYLYCLVLSGAGCANWIFAGDATSVAVGPLAEGTYTWLVKAENANGEKFANGGTWWSFIVPPKPGAFNKTSPLNNSINKPTTLTLYWSLSKNAVKYEYCIKKSMSATCVWKSTGLTRHVTLKGLLKNTKYFWQVRAKNANGTTLSNSGTWWNFKTIP